MSSSSSGVKDHYQVLNVPLDADAAVIKKAHRKLALKWHPDKNVGNQDAADMFRHIQQAYECLSDTAERKWYDEHREAILQGWSPNDNNNANGDNKATFVVDVVPYMHPGCFSGYGDDDGGFFAVYSDLFQQVFDSEQEGWVNEGNIEAMPHSDLPHDFGRSDSDWDLVGNFYRHWESFSSCRSFAWADKYDSKDAEDRRMRRAMEEENKKARKKERREFHESIEALVHFCKRRDPRVDAQKERAELQKEAKKDFDKKEVLRKKEMAKQAREKWRQEAEERMAREEEEDLQAGRVRLADLDDDYDYGGKRGRKGRKKKKQQEYEEHEEYYFRDSESEGEEDGEKKKDGESNEEADGEGETTADERAGSTDAQQGDATEIKAQDQDAHDDEQQAELEDSFSDSYDDEESESSSEEEPDLNCECCRKQFKSEGQLNNHLKSKKHKELFKKWQAKRKKEEAAAAMGVLMDDLVLEK